MQHFSLHSVCSSTGDEFSKKGKRTKEGSRKLFHNPREKTHSLYRKKGHFEIQFFQGGGFIPGRECRWQSIAWWFGRRWDPWWRSLQTVEQAPNCKKRKLLFLLSSGELSSLFAPKPTSCIAFSRIISLSWWHQQESFWCYLARQANCYQPKCK